jgi:hypothetical protein
LFENLKKKKYKNKMQAKQVDIDYGFRVWMKTNDFKIENEASLMLIQSTNDCEGRCVIATKDFEPGELIAQIQFKHLVNYRFFLKHSDLVEFVEWTIENKKAFRFSRLDALYLYLIIQKYNSNSELNGFVKSMPNSYDTPEYFDSKLIEILPDHLKLDIVNRLNKFQKKFNTIFDLLKEFESFKGAQQLSEQLKILIKEFTYENFKWAFDSVNTRCFHLAESELANEQELTLANKLFGQLNSVKNFF